MNMILWFQIIPLIFEFATTGLSGLTFLENTPLFQAENVSSTAGVSIATGVPPDFIEVQMMKTTFYCNQ